MSSNHGASCNRDTLLENFAAQLASAVYGIALQHGIRGSWLDLELDLWKALAKTVEEWGRDPRFTMKARV